MPFQQSGLAMITTHFIVMSCGMGAYLLLVVLHQAVLTHGAARVWPARIVSWRPHWLGIALVQSTCAIQLNSKGSVLRRLTCRSHTGNYRYANYYMRGLRATSTWIDLQKTLSKEVPLQTCSPGAPCTSCRARTWRILDA